jgi:hypothetical protein
MKTMEKKPKFVFTGRIWRYFVCQVLFVRQTESLHHLLFKNTKISEVVYWLYGFATLTIFDKCKIL